MSVVWLVPSLRGSYKLRAIGEHKAFDQTKYDVHVQRFGPTVKKNNSRLCPRQEWKDGLCGGACHSLERFSRQTNIDPKERRTKQWIELWLLSSTTYRLRFEIISHYTELSLRENF